MYTYKVFNLDAPSKGPKRRGYIDSYELSKQLEALLIEQEQLGYELVTITPVTANVAKIETILVTAGLIVTFKKVN